jgi:hypothetical protein
MSGDSLITHSAVHGGYEGMERTLGLETGDIGPDQMQSRALRQELAGYGGMAEPAKKARREAGNGEAPATA